MNKAAPDRSDPDADQPPAPANPGRAQGLPAAPRPGLFTRLSSQFGSRGLHRHGPVLEPAARRELLVHGVEGIATVLDQAERSDGGHEFWVRIRVEDQHPYEIRVRQRVSNADLEWMQPGDIIACRVDPGDRERVALYLPAPEEATRTNIAKILAHGRRAQATVLAATPVAADYRGRENPVLRLDLELHAWDEPAPWRVRVVQPVPLAALELVDLGCRLAAAFFTVDRGESVAIDWAASREQ
ncbi:hypothetical protein LTV02_27900 [Nocardia yamanashiensis]|uniref:hypothetical protein n=1 Tax=Nocardia yamanashiensis TaxID=209247 RepID=UPI001E2DC942|nr:hypothetical protein [Nocardia yamanashiensis]UGT39859.1 hypothetical protein LTV02_27900 [Nocardia yamanashiensis]